MPILSFISAPCLGLSSPFYYGFLREEMTCYITDRGSGDQHSYSNYIR